MSFRPPGDARTPILYIAPWVDLGGSDKGTIDWFKHVDRERWAPSLITTQPSPNRWLGQVEPYAEEIWELPDLMPGGRFPEFILGFIESREIRLVHIMNSRLGFDLLPDMACLPRPPAVVVQMHAEEPGQVGYVRYATRRYGNLVDAFSVTSEHLKEIVSAYEIPPSRIEVIHSGVDAEREFDPGSVEPLGGEDEGLPRVLWPGRLVEQKDPMLTLEVLALVRRRGCEFVLDLVGDGPMAPAVRERAEELDVAGMIRWHPPSQEIARWYRGADLMLMTSVYEGVPYVIYESLAMGVPVVAPALPGNLELMDPDSGALVDPRDDAERYADAIVDLLGDAERRREMGRRSRRRMLEEFSLAEMGRRHDALYERLLGSRPASSRWRDEELFGAAVGDSPTATPPAPLALPRDPAPERTVGVVVPCFRHGTFLAECIESIKAQTLPAAQVIVVDDGSDDPETVEALRRLDDDPDVTVERLGENRGPSAARNRGLELLRTGYMLPIDADDRLLPDALERMLGQLEAAPEDVGFVYPHAQHFGNRSDFVRLPAYNLWLLMQENYCPAPALFDRRVFEGTGIAYPEEIVVGHEDWDLILRLAEHGVRGIHADCPTFLYRQQGFSRVNAVDYGPHEFHEAIERRHPALYGEQDEIKAQWAPALSFILLGDEREWEGLDLGGLLSRQTCRDFEVLAAGQLAAGVWSVAGGDKPSEWLQRAIHAARGRWVCLVTSSVAGILARREFAEKLIHAFVSHTGVSAVVLGHDAGARRHALAQLDDGHRLRCRPGGIAFDRTAGKLEVVLRDGDPLTELAVGLQAHGWVQWRTASAGDDTEAERGIRSAAAPGILHLGYDRAGDPSDVATRDAIVRQRPRLPELTAGTVRRWDGVAPWLPPGTHPLCRHVEVGGELRVVSNERRPPPGFELEFMLGAVHAHAAPGTLRLVESERHFSLTEDQDDLGPDHHAYGFVEQHPLPLLEPLGLGVLPATGQEVLVAGVDDPLRDVAEPLRDLGWVEPIPILPRRGLLQTGPWGVDVLCRNVEERGRRHRYATAPPGESAGLTALGSLFRDPAPGLVALRQREDGRLDSELGAPGRATRDPRRIGRWIGAPLKVRSGRESLSRLGQLAAPSRPRRLRGGRGETLGWLRAEPASGCAPLFSTTHPVTGDQLVTRSLYEAEAHGYLPDAVLGHVLRTGSESPL